MERDKFIRRVRSNEDRREIKIFLTDYAKSLHNRAIEIAKTINELALESFTIKNKKLFNQLLRDTIANLENHLEIKKD
jgi:DNA-binding MarR family transcriptional regulator